MASGKNGLKAPNSPRSGGSLEVGWQPGRGHQRLCSCRRRTTIRALSRPSRSRLRGGVRGGEPAGAAPGGHNLPRGGLPPTGSAEPRPGMMPAGTRATLFFTLPRRPPAPRPRVVPRRACATVQMRRGVGARDVGLTVRSGAPEAPPGHRADAELHMKRWWRGEVRPVLVNRNFYPTRDYVAPTSRTLSLLHHV